MTELKATPAVQIRRGRPSGHSKRNVAEDLLSAMERFIIEQGYPSMSDREIAAAAGTSEAMIHYYFRGRDGLLYSAIDRVARKTHWGLRVLESAMQGIHTNPTRFLVAELLKIYGAQPAVSKLVLGELIRPKSAIKDKFVKYYGHLGPLALQRLLDRLVERGVYRRELDTACASLAILSLVHAHIVFQPLTDSFQMGPDPARWLDHLVDLLERQFCAEQPEPCPRKADGASEPIFPNVVSFPSATPSRGKSVAP